MKQSPTTSRLLGFKNFESLVFEVFLSKIGYFFHFFFPICRASYIISLIIISQSTFAQTLWSDVRLSRNSVYVGEPVQVTISVYTSTWFTSGIDPGNIKVKGAFTAYFRPLSTSIIQNGKTYPGVRLYYHVFPFDEKDLEFPSLKIEVETPKEGDFKGVKRTLTTKPQTIRVLPIPPGMDKNKWMVTQSLSVYDHWNTSLKEVKVGDVLQRSIRINVAGTVSELIPPIIWDSIPGVSLYPIRSEVNNQKGKTAISASRSESMRFLMEKEGEVQFPEMVFSWYNPRAKKMYKRTLKPVTIKVLHNPDLGMLESVRDSLGLAQQQEMETDKDDTPTTILGLTPTLFTIIVLVVLLLLVVLLKYLPKLNTRIKNNRERYHQSELYFFRQFLSKTSKTNQLSVINSLYHWLDHLHLKEPSAKYFASKFGSSELIKDITMIEQYSSNQHSNLSLNNKAWKEARSNYFKQLGDIRRNEDWINP